MPPGSLNPRSLLFTLYGDYVHPLGQEEVRVGAHKGEATRSLARRYLSAFDETVYQAALTARTAHLSVRFEGGLT